MAAAFPGFLTWLTYTQITALENGGESIRTHVLVAIAYELGGKTVAVLIWAVPACLFAAIGVGNLRADLLKR